jgi:hypothetical protein
MSSMVQADEVIIEGAMVKVDNTHSTAIVMACATCPRMILDITESTEVFVDHKRQPYTSDVNVDGLSDTSYDPLTKAIHWFRPLPGTRQ